MSFLGVLTYDDHRYEGGTVYQGITAETLEKTQGRSAEEFGVTKNASK